jgi:PPOX class probable F420-dependent enzyme
MADASGPLPLGLTERDRYLSLVTFRRDGTPVATPVWFAALPDGRLAVVIDAQAGKRKRLRNDPRCTVSACDVRGRTHGPVLEASAAAVDDPDAMRPGLRALGARYGLQWRAFNLTRRLRRRPDHDGRALLLITVAG